MIYLLFIVIYYYKSQAELPNFELSNEIRNITVKSYLKSTVKANFLSATMFPSLPRAE